MTFTSSTEHLAFDSSLKNTCGKMENVVWKLITLFSFLISFIALIIGIVAMDKSQAPSALPPSQSVSSAYPTSCKNVAGASGLYMIKPKTVSFPFQVYCDMDSAGGGWTLVASVHENNIDGKCTVGDKWSSEQGTADNPKGSGNWENTNVFGQLETITNQDYKNPAYYAVQASDIMIWQVPNEKKIYEISNAAKLKYYTNNRFLASRTGTLQGLYSKKLPLKPAVGGLHKLAQWFNKSSSTITSKVPNWFSYKYDGQGTYIRDGGKDMYDRGNTISFSLNNGSFTTMVYNSPYFFYANGLEVKTSAGYPFIALTWIGTGLGNVSANINYFSFRVKSNFGADGKGKALTYPNKNIAQGSLTARYTAFNIVNASDPSVCEVYFYIASKSLWKSRAPQNIVKTSWTNKTREANNIVKFTGSPKNVLIGYTLLSKAKGQQVTPSEVEAVLKEYMKLAEKFKFAVDVPHVVAPINYIKGNNSVIMNGVPKLRKTHVQAGYIQFRAFNSVGLPNALCPGVRVNSDNPEEMCIGGTNSALRDIKQCGDFAGWAGVGGGNSLNQATPTDTGKSLDDINSSFLIFTR